MRKRIEHMAQHVWSHAVARTRRFAREEDGSVTDYLLVVGIISLPLVIFLAIFGQNIVTWVKDNAPNIFNEANDWVG